MQAVEIPLSAADLAPEGVTIAPDSSVFRLETTAPFVGGRLSELCDVCRPLHGAVAPKPGFWATPYNFIFPAAALGPVAVSGGSIQLVFVNNLNFDPIRPSATARGSVTIVVLRGSTELIRYRLDGVTDSLPPGTVFGVGLPLPAFIFDQPLGVWAGIDSPAGDSIAIDTTRFLAIRVGPISADIPQVTVNVDARTVSDSGDIDLTDTDSDFATRIQGGGFRLDIENPFNIGGEFELRVVGSGVSIEKTVTILAGGSTTNRIGLTTEEVRSMLGKVVRVYWSGNFSAPGGTVTITPRQVARITIGLEMTLYPLGDAP